MANRDSFDKIISTYFVGLAKESFIYNGKQYDPPESLVLSKSFYKKDNCVEFCGGCCSRFSLDYLPSEKQAIKNVKLVKRIVHFNNKKFKLFSDLQIDHAAHHCRYMSKKNGYCDIHNHSPLSCDFELLRIIHYQSSNKIALMNKMYGRGWNMLQYDEKERGAKCYFTDDFDLKEMTRKLLRLEDWFKHFKIKSHIPLILELIKHGYIGLVNKEALNMYIKIKGR